MIGKVRNLAYLFEKKRYFHGGVKEQYRLLGLGGKPTDASMIFHSNPYKEMANNKRQKTSHRLLLNFFFAQFF